MQVHSILIFEVRLHVVDGARDTLDLDCRHASFKLFKLLIESFIGLGHYSFKLDILQRLLERPSMVLHEVGNYNSGTTGDPSITVNKNIGQRSVLMNEVNTIIKMLHDRIVGFIVSFNSLVEWNRDRIVRHG